MHVAVVKKQWPAVSVVWLPVHVCVQLASIPDYVHSQKEETAINLNLHCEIDRRMNVV